MSAAALGVPLSLATAQPERKLGQYSDVVVQGSILEPEKIQVEDDRELANLVEAPDGFTAEVFARDLVNPRMLAISDDGTLYATRRRVSDVMMLNDKDGDGKAERVQTVASRSRHGWSYSSLQDLPIQRNEVTVRLRLSRWRCTYRQCERRTFI